MNKKNPRATLLRSREVTDLQGFAELSAWRIWEPVSVKRFKGSNHPKFRRFNGFLANVKLTTWADPEHGPPTVRVSSCFFLLVRGYYEGIKTSFIAF